MFLPSIEAAKITINLLDEFRFEDTILDAIKPGYKYVSPEEFLHQHFEKNSYSEELQDMITEFFFRISKYRKYLYMILQEFAMTKTFIDLNNSQEISIYLVLLYMLVVELNEYTKNKVQKVITSIDEKRTLAILNSFKSCDILTKLYEWGCRIWDVEFVKNTLQNIITRPLFEELYDTITNRQKNIKANKIKIPTKPVTPNFTKRSKKKLAIEKQLSDESESLSRIPVLKKPIAPPPSTYKRPKQQENLEMAKHRNKLNAKKLLDEANRNAFNASKCEKSERFKEIIKKYEKEKFEAPVRKTSSKKIKIKDEPPPPPPRKTATVILREGARLLKLEQEEIKKYEYLASGGFNDDWLTELQEEIREREYQKHLEEIEKKHLEGLLSYEESLLAKQKFMKKKRDRVEEFKKEKENWLKQLEILRNEEHLKILEAFEKGKSIGRAAKDAMVQIKEEKYKLAHELMEESKVLRERWLKEKEEDLQRKVQLIKEIKALQAIGEIRIKQVDLTETANLGLLYEMSIAELKERLFLMKMEMAEELEKRKADVRMKKECRKVIIDSYEDLIESHQKIVEEQKRNSEVKDKKDIKERKPLKPTQSIEYLRRKIRETKKERAKLEIVA